MSLEGSLRSVPFRVLVQLLGSLERTGVLTVESSSAAKRVAFENGLAVYCSSGRAKEQLGHHLLAGTRLTEEELEEALRTQEQGGGRLGEILAAAGLVTREQVQGALARRIEDSLLEIFGWDVGRFSFVEGPLTDAQAPVRFPWPWKALALEGTRRRHDLERIRGVIASDAARFSVLREELPPEFRWEPDEDRILALVAQGRTVREICDALHASDFEILSLLARRVEQGVLEVVPAQADGRGSADEQLASGTRALEEDRLEQALAIFRAAVHRHGDDARLLAGLRRVSQRLRGRLEGIWGGAGTVPVATTRPGRLRELGLSARREFVLARAQAGWPIRSILRVAPFDELDVLAALDGLLRDGLLERPEVACSTPRR